MKRKIFIFFALLLAMTVLPRLVQAQVTKGTVKDGADLELVLNEDRKGMEEIVDVGYGKQRKMALAGAIASVGGSELTKQLSPDFGASLKGLLPGLTVVQSIGMPGGDEAALY